MVHKSDKGTDSESRKSIQNVKSMGIQIVDPQYNELLFKFRFLVSNIESLLHSCEQYKRSLRYFFRESIKMFELFHQVLDERDIVLSSSPVNPPYENSVQDSPPSSVLHGWAKASEDHNLAPDIGRLQKQMAVIVHRAEQDLLFFEKSVQGPLVHLISISRNINHTMSRRDVANAEWGQLATKHHDLIRNRALGKKDYKYKHEEVSVVKKLQISLEKFDTLNELCKDGLVRFLNLSNQLIKGWFRNYYYTSLRISYALHHFSWNVPEFRRIGIPNSLNGENITNANQLATAIASTSSVCQDFHTVHDAVSRHVVLLVQGLNNRESS